ncbi:hypothetical protein HYDPIDRAFT_108435 [Hydnomerulius pinastri MD-312]|nr:hypothetical protein HYDPIDRAFT_108435 [Hydnomerulius pinastri MD-312]
MSKPHQQPASASSATPSATSPPNAAPASAPGPQTDGTPASAPDATPDATPASAPNSKPNAPPASAANSKPDAPPISAPASKPDAPPVSAPAFKPNAAPASAPASQTDAAPALTPAFQSDVPLASAPASLPDTTLPSSSDEAPPASAPHSRAASPKTFNIILFGETGVGKSSVINLIAGRTLAKVSSDVDGCTMASTPYDFTLESLSFRIYDTVGLEEPQMGVNGYLAAIEKAFTLIRSLGDAGGVHLLLFCLRGGRITATVQSNYRLFYEFLCDKQVPIALVFTGLERERNMEDWWVRNASNIKKYGIDSIGHACITAVKDDPSGQEDKYTESENKIRALLTQHAVNSKAFQMEGEGWLTMFLRRFQGLMLKKSKPKPKETVKTLVKRCGMDPVAAKRVAELIRQGEPGEKAPAH